MVDLSRGILPGLQVADQLRNSRAARESQAQADMIALSNFEREQELEAIEAEAFQSLGSIVAGEGGKNTRVAELEGDAEIGDKLIALGNRVGKAGFSKRAQELLEAGLDAKKKVADTEKTYLDADDKRLEVMTETADWVARNLGENESEFRLFQSMLSNPQNAHIRRNLGEEHVAILENMEWSPELANYFRSKALSIKDQADLALRGRAADRQEKSAADTETYRAALLDINRGNLQERRNENARKAKADGGDVSKVGTPGEIASARAVIMNTVQALEGAARNDKGEIADPLVADAISHMAENVVGRAKELIAENKGFTFDQAVEQAVMEAETAGDFEVIEPVVRAWRSDIPQKPGKYKRKGMSTDNPIELPDGDAAAVAKKLVKGRYYNTPMGVLKWNGSSFDQ